MLHYKCNNFKKSKIVKNNHTSYEFIDHKEKMSGFTKSIKNNKQTRQELFYILRNHDYMDKFYDCLKKHDLYEEYCDFSVDYYNFIFKEWCEKT